MSTSGGGFAASGLLQGFAQAYTAARIRATQMDIEQRHGLAQTLMQLYPNARPEAQADIAQRLLQIYSTPPGKKLDKGIGDVTTLGRAAAQANAPGATPQGQQAAQAATARQTQNVNQLIASQGAAPQAIPAPPGPAGVGPAPEIVGATPGTGAQGGGFQLQTPKVPPPPQYSPLLSPEERNQLAAAQITSQKEAELRAELNVRSQEAERIGLKPGTPQYENFVAGRMLTPFGRQQQEWFITPDGKQIALNHDSVTGQYTDPNTNEIVNTAGMTRWAAGEAIPKRIQYSDPNDPTHKLFGFQVGGMLKDQSGNPLPPGVYTIDDGMVPKTVTTTTPKVDSNGQYQNFTETHTTTPLVPGGKAPAPGIPAPPGAPGAPAKPSSGGGSRTAKTKPPKANVAPVVDAQGNPVYGPNAAKWAMWTNPDTGQQEAGPLSMAPKGSNPALVGSQEQRDNINARHALTLMTKVGDPSKPETMGVLQLINALDKEGKLGVLASRYNNFVTKGIGASPDDDPRIIMLINKNMLSDTATMLAHFGASGGRSPQMLQHFLDMANAGKMDAATLKAGTEAIADYMKDRAMIPQGPKSNVIPPPPNNAGKFVVRDPNGKDHPFDTQEQADRFRQLMSAQH